VAVWVFVSLKSFLAVSSISNFLDILNP